MSQETRFADAVCPGKTKVGFTMLEPLSFGHYVLAFRYRSAVAVSPESIGPGDVAWFLTAFSRPWREAEKYLETARARREIRARAFLLRRSRGHLAQCLSQLDRYFTWHYFKPKTWDSSKETGSTNTMGWVETIRAVLSTETSYTSEEIWGFPLRQAVHEYLMVLSAKGDLKFRTDEHDAMIREAQERTRAAREEESDGGNN